MATSAESTPVPLYKRPVIRNMEAYVCDVCNKKFHSRPALRKHFNENPDEIRYECSICGNQFKSLCLFEKHATFHAYDTKLPAEFAVKTKDGENTAAGEVFKNKEFPCDACSEVCKSESNLEDHKNLKHVDPPPHKPWKCDVCGKCYHQLYKLDEHYGDHLDGLPFWCNKCNVRFAMEKTMSYHNRIEHPPWSDDTNKFWKHYGCKYCPMRFVHKQNFILHERSHTLLLYPFPCDECDESFLSEEQLNEHYEVHVEEHYAFLDVVASHGCNKCLKIFPSLPQLEEHKLTHDDPESVLPIEINAELVEEMLSDVTKHELNFVGENIAENEISVEPSVILTEGRITSNTAQDICQLLVGLNNTETNAGDTEGVNDNSNSELQTGSAENSNSCEAENQVILDESQVEQIISNCTVLESEENGIKTYYIISENGDTFDESNILASNCVISIDNTEEVRSVAQDIEINGIDFVDDSEKLHSDRNIEENAESLQEAQDPDYIRKPRKYVRRALNPDADASEQNKMWPCRLCTRTYASKNGLDYHMSSMHSGGRRYNCSFCEKRFLAKPALRAHLKTHTKPYVCGKCKKTFSSNNLLRQHLRYHDGIKPYTCKTCGKGCATSNTLKTHNLLHTDYRPYVCETCGKGFKAKFIYESHMMIHRGERPPNTCEICDRVCLSKSQLAIHASSHSDVKPLKCKYCEKTFKHRSYMINHEVTHTNEAKYRCDLCGKPFFLSYEYRRHLELHSKEAKYLCDYCGKAFTQRHNIRRHLKQHAAELEK